MSSWIETTLVISAGVLTIFNLVDRIVGYWQKSKEPNEILKDRIDILERKVETAFTEYDSRFGRDKARLDSLEEGNKIVQKSLLALLEHSIDGNNTDGLKKAKEELSQYLINR